jgi:hypothetical protein
MFVRGFPTQLELFYRATSSSKRKRKVMAVINNRVAMTFVQIPDSQMAEFANGTITGMDIPQFDGAPVNKAAMTALQTTFVQSLAAARNGGRVEIAEKNVARTALVAALR